MTLFALFGFLPLAIVLYKKRRVDRIVKNGITAKARVYDIRSNGPLNYDMQTPMRKRLYYVHYTYYGPNMQQLTGVMMVGENKYNKDDIIDVYYLPDNPRRSTVKGAWQSKGLIVFTALIAAFVVFAAFKIYRMLETGVYE
jgi:hypothetical protein